MLTDGEQNTKRGASIGFIKWTQEMDLIDIGFIGPQYTWNRGNEVETRRSTRLDRVMCDDEWCRTFPEAVLRHLHHSYSEHWPILLQTSEGASNCLGNWPFKFQAAWMEHKEFEKVMNEN